jgi:hypothetical protein
MTQNNMNQLKDLSPFNWISETTDEGLHPQSPWSYLSEFLPNQFAAYCKIYHTIYEDLSVTDRSITWDEADRRRGNTQSKDVLVSGDPGETFEGRRITWEDLASAYGLEYHAEMTQDSFTENFPNGSWLKYLIAPAEGTLDEDECPRLVEVLEPFTKDQPCCFFYNSLAQRSSGDSGGALFTGNLSDVDALSSEEDYYLTPTYWWPDDKSWTVFTDPDYAFTLVGGSQELIDAILADTVLEAVAVELATPITPNSDQINIKDDQTETK